MKRILTLALVTFFSANIFANGGFYPEKPNGEFYSEKAKRGTAGVDETYVDEIKHKESALQKQEKTREKMKENPRNEAFPESFGHIYSKEDDQQKEEEKKAVERQEAREGEAGGEKTEGTVWELEKKDRD